MKTGGETRGRKGPAREEEAQGKSVREGDKEQMIYIG